MFLFIVAFIVFMVDTHGILSQFLVFAGAFNIDTFCIAGLDHIGSVKLVASVVAMMSFMKWYISHLDRIEDTL